MGVVVAAKHLVLEQHVAIKFLAGEALRNKDVVERFKREAKVGAKVKSEHVTRVHDVGTVAGGVPYIVMEYLEGRDLGDIIKKDGELPLDEACEIALQACEALAEVHAAGIVHRDLKPSNLFITRRSDASPCVKLLDFGISKFTVHLDDPSGDPGLTATATILGSPLYMSPEQLKSTKDVDAGTDIWSLGAVLYEALTARPAFRAETVLQVCAMIASDDPPLPSTLRSSLPIELERGILACLEKKPAKRSSLVEFARVLAQYAPDRARACLERIEAVAGPAEARPRSSMGRVDSKPPTRRSRQQSSPETRDRRGKRAGWSPLVVLLVGATGVFAFGVYSGSIHVSALLGDVANATSSVPFVIASAIPEATASSSHDGPAASQKPPPVPAAAPAEPPSEAAAAEASDLAAPSASALPSANEKGDDGGEEPLPLASAIASALAPYLAPYAGPAPSLTPPSSPPHAPAVISSAAKKHPPSSHNPGNNPGKSHLDRRVPP
jgi:serine/threonine-protein kinase